MRPPIHLVTVETVPPGYEAMIDSCEVLQRTRRRAGVGHKRERDQGAPVRRANPCPTGQGAMGAAVRRARVQRGVTQAQLAETTGLPLADVEAVESGRMRFPPQEVVDAIGAALQVQFGTV